jgi:uncharacterized protein (TIGR00369 family)
MREPNAAVMSPAEIQAFLEEEFPEVFGAERHYLVEDTRQRACRMRLIYHPRHLRPGGTISGPAMMTLADTAMYVAILASIGRVPLAVTTNLSINFLKKPAQRDLIAECRLLKLGKRLAVGEVDIHSEGEGELVAHVTSTYSIPPERSGASI